MTLAFLAVVALVAGSLWWLFPRSVNVPISSDSADADCLALGHAFGKWDNSFYIQRRYCERCNFCQRKEVP